MRDIDLATLQRVKRLRAWSLARAGNICALMCAVAMVFCLVGSVVLDLQNAQNGKVLFFAFFAFGALAVIMILAASRLRNFCNLCGNEIEEHHENHTARDGHAHFTTSYVCLRCKKFERRSGRWSD
jgi:hypothetical protein